MMKKAGLEYLIELRDLCTNPLEQWRATHATFDDYCRERLGYGERRVRQLIAADDTRNLLLMAAGDDEDLKPTIREMKEDALRPLSGLTGDKAVEVVRMAITLPSKQRAKAVTLAKIKKVKARVIEPVTIVDADTHQIDTSNIRLKAGGPDRVTDARISEWQEMHGIGLNLHDARKAYEDAQSFTPAP